MRQITEHNYEAYLLDYLEGTLHPSLLSEMEGFLAEHPHLMEEVQELEMVKLVPDDVTFPHAQSLLRNAAIPAEGEYAPLFSAAADGTLDQAGEMKVQRMLREYPHLEKEYKAYQLTRLSPDLSVIFPGAAELKKAVPLFAGLSFTTVVRVAAIAALLLASVWVFLLIKPDMGLKYNDMAVVPPVSIEPKVPPAGGSSERTVLMDEAVIAGKSGTHSQAIPDDIRNDRNDKARHSEQTIQTSADHAQELARLEPLPLDPASLRYIVATDRPSFGLAPSIRLRDLMWLTADPLLAEAATEEVVWKGRLGGLLTRRNKNNDQIASNRKSVTQRNLWRVADASVTAINLLTDNTIEIQKEVDEDGRVVAYALLSDRFAFSRKRKMD